MLYQLLKVPAKLAFIIYCRTVLFNTKKHLNFNGPLLIAANHPNSFLDAIVIATLFKQPVYSLVRGDVYTNNFYRKILTALKMLPVYRISEGAENLDQNYETFQKCRAIFKRNGIVLIFSEGRCVNEWHLRPLKKGTARLALSSWEEGIDLKVLPLGINFQSFESFGKNIHLNFGSLFGKEVIDHSIADGRAIASFNEKLKDELKSLVIEINPDDHEKVKSVFYKKQSLLKRIVLTLPALIGFLVHLPLYLPVKKYVTANFGDSGHYDSVIIAALFVAYPAYLLLISILVCLLTSAYWWLSVFLVLPFCAWSYGQLKKQFDFN